MWSWLVVVVEVVTGEGRRYGSEIWRRKKHLVEKSYMAGWLTVCSNPIPLGTLYIPTLLDLLFKARPPSKAPDNWLKWPAIGNNIIVYSLKVRHASLDSIWTPNITCSFAWFCLVPPC